MDKKEYAEVCYPNDSHMRDFVIKDTFEVVDLSTGAFALDKIDIKTHFCFGYGFCGITSQEDMERADRMTKAARQSDYFMEKNLEEIDEKIKLLTLALENDNFFKDEYRLHCIILHEHYTDVSGVVTWTAADSREVEGVITKESICESYGKKYFRNGKETTIATKHDIELLLAAYNRQRENLVKRLNTWWKRYGASHLNTWSYLVD